MGIYNFHRFCMATSAIFFAGLAVFLLKTASDPNVNRTLYLVCAIASVALAATIVPYLLRFNARLSALKSATNLICIKCEYDLRGTIAAGVQKCPECGTPIAGEMMAMGKLF